MYFVFFFADQTIRCSNLCTEIVEFTSPEEIAVCNLASVALPMFVRPDRTFDHQKLFDVTYTVVRNLNRVIDINYYPVERQAHTVHTAFAYCSAAFSSHCSMSSSSSRTRTWERNQYASI